VVSRASGPDTVRPVETCEPGRMALVLDRGRDAHARRAWSQAVALLSAADDAAPLEALDLERLAEAAYLVGRDKSSEEAWARAHREWARIGNVAHAARSAFWLAFILLNNGDVVRASGWVDRTRRLLDEAGADCVEQGYIRYLVALRAAFEGDPSNAHVTFTQAVEIGRRFDSSELMTLARVGQGRCLVYLGDVDAGMALLDEAMVALTATEMSPVAIGDLYCTVVDACHELFDLRRAREWTGALSRWCDEQPDLVMYRGQCTVHRAELMQFRGAWSDAMEEVDRACQHLTETPGQPMIGSAFYLRADLHRLRGEFAKAERQYRQASEHGRDPQPGLALLRLAQGQTEAAAATIRRVLDEVSDPAGRARVLAPYAEIMLAAQDVAAARMVIEELDSIARDLNAPYLRALAAQVAGTVEFAEGDARAALGPLRRAWAGWRDLEAPYDAARSRVMIALACRALGDEDSAQMELDAARTTLRRLEAAPDLARIEQIAGRPAASVPGGLSARELEVLILVARGGTNRGIAAELVISDRTVASHVSHIFTKLGVSNRSAATAYAYDHGLV